MTENSGAHARILGIVAEGVVVFAMSSGGSARAFSSSHTSWLFPRVEQARACKNSNSSFCYISFATSHLKFGKEIGEDLRGWGWLEEVGGDEGCDKNCSWYPETGKNNFNTGNGFPEASPTLVLKSWLGLWEVEDWWIKLDVEELRRRVGSSMNIQHMFGFDFSVFNILNIILSALVYYTTLPDLSTFKQVIFCVY